MSEPEPGVLLPYPPCCEAKCTKMRACGEDNSFCYKLGDFGHSENPFGVPRHKWMYTAAAINIVCLTLLIAGACGVSDDKTTLKNTYWSKSTLYGIDIYAGPTAILLESSGYSEIETWSDLDCDGLTGDSYDACQDCSEASQAVVSTAIIGVLTTLPTIMTDFQRSTRAGDLNCQKFMALLTGLLGGLSSLATLLTYADNCFEFGDNAKAGPGFQLQWIGTVVKFVDIFFHLALKTPPYKRGGEDGEHLAPAMPVN